MLIMILGPFNTIFKKLLKNVKYLNVSFFIELGFCGEEPGVVLAKLRCAGKFRRTLTSASIDSNILDISEPFGGLFFLTAEHPILFGSNKRLFIYC